MEIFVFLSISNKLKRGASKQLIVIRVAKKPGNLEFDNLGKEKPGIL